MPIAERPLHPGSAGATAPLDWRGEWAEDSARAALFPNHGSGERALGASPAETMPLALGSTGNLYTFTLSDPGDLVTASIESQITVCAQYVIGLVSRYLSWQGTLDFVVEIKPASQSPYPEINGIMPTVA